METAALIHRLWPIVEEELRVLGYELVELEFGRQGGAALLRVFIDKDGAAISLEDCTRASHVLNPVLDDADCIRDAYMMEVSSPGFNRPVRKIEHFRRYIGQTFRVTTCTPIEGQTRFKGVLNAVDADLICLQTADRDFSFHFENIKKARLDR